jgi:hypothetical protein
MNSEQVTLLLRQILSSVVGPALVSYGIIQNGQVDTFTTSMLTIGGILVTALTMAYGQWKKSRTQMIKSAAAQSTPAAPVTVVTDAATASKLPDNVLSVNDAKVVKASSAAPSIDPGPPPGPKPGQVASAHVWPVLALLPVILALAGCGSQAVQRLEAGVGAITTVATAEVKNPVTLTMVYDFRAAHVAAQRVALAYRRIGICPLGVDATVTKPCASRAVMARIITLDKAARTNIDALESYVRVHPTLDATNLYEAARAALSKFQSATPQTAS